MHASPRNFDLPDLAATESFGRQLGALLFPGAVVALIGPLGAGKTHLARAIAEGMEIADARVVTGPTFVLIQEYSANVGLVTTRASAISIPSAMARARCVLPAPSGPMSAT